MTDRLTEQQLAAALHRAVGEPQDHPRRSTQVREKARLLRRRRVAAGSSFVAVALVAVAIPTLLSPGADGPSGRPGQSDQPSLPATSAVLGCATAGACHRQTVPAGLRRPLALPQLSAGQPCPVSASRRFAGGGGFSDSFTALGPGPLYLTPPVTIPFDYPPPKGSAEAGSGWSGSKVIWVIDSAYSGPVLIRGAQLDGRHQLRFDRYIGAIGYSGSGAGDGKAYRELVYPAEPGTPALRTYPSAVRLKAPGCYAMQVDGRGFSERIVFRARVNHGP